MKEIETNTPEEHIYTGAFQISARETFIRFYNPPKLMTIEEAKKTVSLTTLNGKLILYSNEFFEFKLLVKSQMENAPIDLENLTSCRLSPAPSGLGTHDAFLSKTYKIYPERA